jgi:vancomycin resistance protein YoaR
VRAETTIFRPATRRRRGKQAALRRGVVLATLLAGGVALVGLAFAGSPATLAKGTEIAGVQVGGLRPSDAVRALERRADAVAKAPVVFMAAGRTFRIAPTHLGVRADWRGAVALARNEADGFAPVRGFRRLHTRFFGAEIAPKLSVYNGALEYELNQIARAVDRPHVEASLRSRGLRIEIVRGQPGTKLVRDAAARTLVRALGSLDRTRTVALPVVTDSPRITPAMLRSAAASARMALSAPVRLTYGETAWRLPRWRLAELLSLPKEGATKVAIAGPGAEAWFARLAKRIERDPVDAGFAVTNGGVRVIPAKPGLELDVPATARTLAGAAFSRADRTARLVVRTVVPERTTAEANAMGITGVVGSYSTTYGGTPGRLHNVQLVSQLIDDTLIAPGETFSFNRTTGERTPEQGFQTAPVIINGELRNGIGGGVCQVSTTVFNAAFEAGLPIEERTNHALYIGHYPQGRDATVNYPDLDLKIRNDTGHWLLLRAFVGTGSLTVSLYGTPQDRRVEAETAALVAVGPVPLRRVKDPTLLKGKRTVERTGAPPRRTSVHRTVYDATGKLLHETTWRSYYVGEPSIVRVGTKKPKKTTKAAKAGGATAAASEAVPPGEELPPTAPPPPPPQR